MGVNRVENVEYVEEVLSDIGRGDRENGEKVGLSVIGRVEV